MIDRKRKQVDTVLQKVLGGRWVSTKLVSGGFLMRPGSRCGNFFMVGRVKDGLRLLRRWDGYVQGKVLEMSVLVWLTK